MNKTEFEQRTRSYDCLDHSVAVYIPSTIGNKAIDNTEQVDDALSFMSLLFGGASAEHIQGAWNGENGLVVENTCKVYSNFAGMDYDKLDQVFDYADNLKVAMNQEAIATEIDGKMYIG